MVPLFIESSVFCLFASLNSSLVGITGRHFRFSKMSNRLLKFESLLRKEYWQIFV